MCEYNQYPLSGSLVAPVIATIMLFQMGQNLWQLCVHCYGAIINFHLDLCSNRADCNHSRASVYSKIVKHNRQYKKASPKSLITATDKPQLKYFILLFLSMQLFVKFIHVSWGVFHTQWAMIIYYPQSLSLISLLPISDDAKPDSHSLSFHFRYSNIHMIYFLGHCMERASK